VGATTAGASSIPDVLDDGPIDLVMIPAATTESSCCSAAKRISLPPWISQPKCTASSATLISTLRPAVRNHVQSRYSSLGPDEPAEKFRMAWSI